MENALIEHWFTFHPAPDAAKQAEHASARKVFLDAAVELNDLVPDASAAEKRIMYRKMREAMHWANSGIAMTHPSEDEYY